MNNEYLHMSVVEDSVTNWMADYLNSNDVTTDTQVSVQSHGARSQPDFDIDGGRFYGEAKWEDKKWEGFGQARDYGQLDGAEGSFLIIYPKALKTKERDTRQSKLDEYEYAESMLSGHTYSCAFLRRDQPTDMARLELDEIPGWITSNVEKKHNPQPDPDEVVSTLRQAARRLNDRLQRGPDEDIFRNVLGVAPDEEGERQAARETAGFLLINQIVFYRVLSAELQFPDVDTNDLSSPTELRWYFKQVLKKDYKPVFSFPIANDLPQDSATLRDVRNVVDSVYALSPEWFYHDMLGKLFHELIPVSTRKPLAAYYTLNDTADILAHLTIDDADTTVLDLACGSGTLLAAAYNRKQQLSSEPDGDMHRQFVEQELTGIDVMPFAGHMSCINLALQAPLYETDKINIGLKDSTQLKPGDVIPPLSLVLPQTSEQREIDEFSASNGPDLSEELVESGSLSLDGEQGEQVELNHVDTVMINPPYSRQESVARFAEEYKTNLRGRFSDRDEKGQIHGKMSFCSYFMFLADKFLNGGGKIAAVLPASLLNKTTDSGVREMLLNEYTIQHVLIRTDRPNFSEDTDMRETLIVAEKGGDSDHSSTAYTSLDGLSEINPTDLQQSVEMLSQGTVKSSRSESQRFENEGYTTRLFPTDELEEHNLFAPFAVANHELFELWYQIRDRDVFTSIDDLPDAWLTGGIGFSSTVPDCKGALVNDPEANLRQNDVWVLKREYADRIVAEHRHIEETVEIPRSNVARDFHRFAYRSRLDLSDLGEYAVIDDDFKNSDRFFDLAEIDGTPSSWPDLVEKRQSHLGFMRRLDLTAAGLSHLSYYSEQPRVYHGMMWCLPGLS